MQEFLDDNNVLSHHQFGFHPGKSSTDLHFHTDVTVALNSKCCLTDTFSNIKQKFDKVWHKGLLHMLRSAGIPNPFTRLISSFLVVC